MGKVRLTSLLSEIKKDLREDEKTVGQELEKNFKDGPEAIVNYLNKNAGDEDLQSILSNPKADGEETDDKAGKGSLSGQAMSFAPTQSEIDLMKSVSYPLGSSKTLTSAINNPIASNIAADSSAGIIIDGHHRWSGVIAIGGDAAQITGTDFELPGNNVAEKLAAAQLVIVAKNKGGKVPSQGQSFKTNILGANDTTIAKMIMSNVNKQTDAGAPGALLNDAMIEDLLVGNDGKIVQDWLGKLSDRVQWGSVTPEGIYQLRLAIAQKVAENLAALPQPPAGAPARKYMPQFDDKATPPGPKVTDAAKDAAAGTFNIAPPFVKDSINKTGKSLNESINKLRWAKLANIKK
jgi:hypothetical protein